MAVVKSPFQILQKIYKSCSEKRLTMFCVDHSHGHSTDTDYLCGRIWEQVKGVWLQETH